MEKFSRDSVLSAFRQAPKLVQDTYYDEKTTDVLIAIQTRYNLHIDVAGVLVREVGYLLLGLITPADFFQRIQEGGINSLTATSIVEEINREIFVPLQKRVRDAAQNPVAESEGDGEDEDFDDGLGWKDVSEEVSELRAPLIPFGTAAPQAPEYREAPAYTQTPSYRLPLASVPSFAAAPPPPAYIAPPPPQTFAAPVAVPVQTPEPERHYVTPAQAATPAPAPMYSAQASEEHHSRTMEEDIAYIQNGILPVGLAPAVPAEQIRYTAHTPQTLPYVPQAAQPAPQYQAPQYVQPVPQYRAPQPSFQPEIQPEPRQFADLQPPERRHDFTTAHRASFQPSSDPYRELPE
jgi:hypothetical protein